MAMIRKTGPSMHIGATSAKLAQQPDSQQHSTEENDPFGEGYDPFGFGSDSPSNDFDSAIKNAFGNDFSRLDTTMKPEAEAPIKKLQFGKGVTMTLLNFGKQEQNTPAPNMPAPIEPKPVAVAPQPDCIESYTFPNGTTIHLKNGMLHRENGPAIEFPGGMGSVYFLEGNLHRDNGPAIHWPYEDDCQWYKHGTKVLSVYQTKDNIKLLRMKMTHSQTNKNKPTE